MPMVKDALANEEARRKDVGSDQTEALVSEQRGRQQEKYQSGRRGRSKSRGRSKDRKKTYKCFHCGIEGHLKKNCQKLQREQGQGNNQPKKIDAETLVVTTVDVAICSDQEEACLHTATQDVEWVVDTAASYHVTPHRDFFTTYKAGDFGAVKMGNTSSSQIVGICEVQLRKNTGYTITLKEVRHVPELRLNLLSGVALDKQGYASHFSNGTWMIKGAMVIARGHICGTLYKTHVKIYAESLNVAESEASQNL